MVILPVGKTLGIVANRVVEEGNTKGGIAQIQRPLMVETTVLEIHLEP